MPINIDGSKGIRQNTTEVTKIPVGTTAQRPANPAAGMIRFNTDQGLVEWYDEVYDFWYPTNLIPVVATGGTVTDITQDGIQYRVHTFTSDGTFEVTRGGEVEYLVVAGGGGGAGHGGKGAGGYRCSVAGELSGGNTPAEPPLIVSAGSLTVVVGAGAVGSDPDSVAGDSQFASVISTGGGSESGSVPLPDSGATQGGAGGSGQGAFNNANGGLANGGAAVAGQGFKGGDITGGTRAGCGGGGAGQAGLNNDESSNGSKGGDGIQSNITGTPTYRAGGGGGAGSGDSALGGLGGGGRGSHAISLGGPGSTNGETNTGGGGGGQWDGDPASGGSGIVIVRYRIG